MSTIKNPNYHHTLQPSTPGICTHIWQNKSLRKILIIDPGYTTEAQISMLVDWQGYEVHMGLSEVSLATCARLTQLKQSLDACLHLHQGQLAALLQIRNQAVAAQACEVFLPQADQVYTGANGNLVDWKDWAFSWADHQMKFTYTDQGA